MCPLERFGEIQHHVHTLLLRRAPRPWYTRRWFSAHAARAGELRTGLLLGAILGLASFFPIWAWWLARTGRDPAFGSGPLATVTQDILSLLVYLGVVRAFGL